MWLLEFDARLLTIVAVVLVITWVMRWAVWWDRLKIWIVASVICVGWIVVGVIVETATVVVVVVVWGICTLLSPEPACAIAGVKTIAAAAASIDATVVVLESVALGLTDDEREILRDGKEDEDEEQDDQYEGDPASPATPSGLFAVTIPDPLLTRYSYALPRRCEGRGLPVTVGAVSISIDVAL